jgi:hypothetical protein
MAEGLGVHRRAAIPLKTKKDARRSNGFPPPGPPGNRGRSSAIPATAPEGLGTARFPKPLEMKKRRSARCPRVAALVQRHPPKPPPRPAGGSHCAALGITWGGLVGDRGHRKGQLRVLGSPSARHTKEPRTGGPPGGAGSPRTRFVFAKVPSYISEGTKTGLQTPRANR